MFTTIKYEEAKIDRNNNYNRDLEVYFLKINSRFRLATKFTMC